MEIRPQKNVTAVVMQSWCDCRMHRPQQRITFSLRHRFISIPNSCAGWNLPCDFVIPRLLLCTKKGGETEDKKRCSAPGPETVLKEKQNERKWSDGGHSSRREEEEEESHWEVPLHLCKRGSSAACPLVWMSSHFLYSSSLLYARIWRKSESYGVWTVISFLD